MGGLPKTSPKEKKHRLPSVKKIAGRFFFFLFFPLLYVVADPQPAVLDVRSQGGAFALFNVVISRGFFWARKRAKSFPFFFLVHTRQ